MGGGQGQEGSWTFDSTVEHISQDGILVSWYLGCDGGLEDERTRGREEVTEGSGIDY